MRLNTVDPLQDSRWDELIARHPRGSVFHSTAWLEALQRSYGYKPVVYSSSAPGSELRDGLVLCQIKSWITGSRLVSLPFSDHCEPLVDEPETLLDMLTELRQGLRQDRWRYLEMRPLSDLSYADSFFQSAEQFFHHKIDLTPSLDSLFHNLHKSSTQRKIKRARREGLSHQEGASESLLKSFYSLFLITRRRHHIPPQPLQWFRNLIVCFGNALRIRVAFKREQPVAAILTLQHKNTLTYKYGCSDPHMNNLGGTHLLFWKAIEEAKNLGMTYFDLGRSAAENAGLMTFKERWGAVGSEMTYLRCYAMGERASRIEASRHDWKLRMAKRIFAHSPDRLLSAAGSLLYKHVG
jgi:CelD/BcsL family acetyltransferase involved in cellulose biosynthesis